MEFKDKIENLDNILSKTQEIGAKFASLAREAASAIDWSNFSRSDILPFLNDPIQEQHYGPYNFGQFNLTLVSRKNYSIQLYLMDRVPTEIHAHCFHGYFHYLQGRVCQSHFERLTGIPIAPLISSNAIKLSREEILYPGNGSVISPGPLHQIMRIDPQSTVLMIMHHRYEKIANEYILPSGHIIQISQPRDKFFRLITLLKNCPELTEKILPMLEPADMILYCFRNGLANMNSLELIQDLCLQELKKTMPVDEIIQAFEMKTMKQQKLSLTGK
jgi:hypothetical protein